MKRIYYILCIAMLFTACKREDKSAKLIEEYQALNERVSEEFEQAESPEAADSILNVFINEAFKLQQAQPESEAAYVILSDIFYIISMEQKEQAFAVLNPDSLEAHDLKRAYEAFQAEKNTAVGLPFTDFNTLTADGNEVAISDFVGKSDFLLMDFWASWCGPCRRSMPGLKELLANHSDRLAILGVSVDQSEESWQQAVEALELTWPQVRDAKNEGGKAYGILGIPHTVLISRDGTILAHNPSHKEIEELLK